MKKKFKNNWNTPTTRKIFRWHVITFTVAILILWFMWWVGIKSDQVLQQKNYTHFPWPVWPTIIWAIVLRYHYLAVYGERKPLSDNIFSNKDKN